MPADLSNKPLEMRDMRALRETLESRLNSVRRAMRAHFAVEAAARLAALLAALAGLSLLLDWWLELSLTARVCTLGVLAIGAGVAVQRFLVRPLQLALAPIDVAAALDTADPGGAHQRLASRVASVLQLPGQIEQPSDASPALIERAVRENHQMLERVDFKSRLNRRHLAGSAAAFLAAVLVPAALGMAFPGTARLWAARWFGGSNQPWPRDTHFEVVGVEDGRFIVPRGEPSHLQVNVTDRGRETETVWMAMSSSDGRDETVTLTRFGPGDFRYDLPPLQFPTDVRIRGGDGRAEPFQIVPLERPRISALRLTAKGPRDSQPLVHNFTGTEGNLRLLPKTDVVLELEANVPVSHIDVETETGEAISFERKDDRHFAARWTHNVPLHARLTLIGRDVAFPSHPRPLSIDEMPDRPPRVSLRHSGVRLRVAPAATIPLTVTSRDDFGITRVDVTIEVPDQTSPGTSLDIGAADADEAEAATLETKTDAGTPDAGSPESGATPADSSGENRTGENPADDPAADGAGVPAAGADAENVTAETRAVHGPALPATESDIEQSLDVDLESRRLQPGRVVVIAAVAADDRDEGAQVTTSRKIVFRVVRPDELFREILLRQQQLRARLRKATDQAEALRDRLPTTTIPDDAAELLRTHQLIRREVGHVSRELDASVVEMRLNKLAGEETWQLITRNVLEPLSRLYEQEMEQQRLALESQLGASPDSFDEVVERQQTIVDALTRILDNMAQWDSFIDVVNQLNSVIELERVVRQKTDELRRTQTESIFDK